MIDVDAHLDDGFHQEEMSRMSFSEKLPPN
jgi:hypothetical protein